MYILFKRNNRKYLNFTNRYKLLNLNLMWNTFYLCITRKDDTELYLFIFINITVLSPFFLPLQEKEAGNKKKQNSNVINIIEIVPFKHIKTQTTKNNCNSLMFNFKTPFKIFQLNVRSFSKRIVWINL